MRLFVIVLSGAVLEYQMPLPSQLKSFNFGTTFTLNYIRTLVWKSGARSAWAVEALVCSGFRQYQASDDSNKGFEGLAHLWNQASHFLNLSAGPIISSSVGFTTFVPNQSCKDPR